MIKNKLQIVIPVIFFITIGFSHAQDDQSFANINGKQITMRTIHQYISQLPPEYKAAIEKNLNSPEEKQTALRSIVEKIITLEVFFKEAIQLKLHKEPPIRQKLRFMAKNILMAEYIKGVQTEIDITSNEIKTYYELHKELFTADTDRKLKNHSDKTNDMTLNQKDTDAQNLRNSNEVKDKIIAQLINQKILNKITEIQIELEKKYRVQRYQIE